MLCDNIASTFELEESRLEVHLIYFMVLIFFSFCFICRLCSMARKSPWTTVLLSFECRNWIGRTGAPKQIGASLLVWMSSWLQVREFFYFSLRFLERRERYCACVPSRSASEPTVDATKVGKVDRWTKINFPYKKFWFSDVAYDPAAVPDFSRIVGTLLHGQNSSSTCASVAHTIRNEATFALLQSELGRLPFSVSSHARIQEFF